ncbi:HPP family protein [Bradyrhizobium sp. SYSU BS000235]|uniref:HPP family protein n=1 Tax=Bradyrhizobium sp. SYSU BS000235 TaxID=3411332 RepID=UPI003C772AE3
MTNRHGDADERSRTRSPSKFFVPILAGATLRDRILACMGALVGIGLTGVLCAIGYGRGFDVPLLVAPMGASAVLLFAVPASPLAQPWSIIGGNTISALVGIAVSRLIHDPVVATGVAVGLAIAAMSLARCLHPPGGAAALTAVLGGPAVASAGFMFAFVPVAVNCIVLVALGWLFHRLSRHTYPHRHVPVVVNPHGTSDIPAQMRLGFREEDVDGALEDLGETFDIDREDLNRLLHRVELRSLECSHGPFRVSDIMSRDVICIDENADVPAARKLLLDHEVRSLPVLDEADRLIGSLGLRELSQPGIRIRDLMSKARTATPDTPASQLIEPLTDGRTHAVTVVDDGRRVIGIVTQTDLLASVLRSPERPALNS